MTAIWSRQYASLWIAVIIALIAGAAGGALTDTSGWYENLQKPFFQPPNWLFGPVWTLIYLLAAWTAHKLWSAASDNRDRQITIILLFGFNVVLNIGWSFCFFFLQRPDFALFEAVVLLISVLMIIHTGCRPVRGTIRYMLPYALWVCFAITLNLAIVRLNAPFS